MNTIARFSTLLSTSVLLAACAAEPRALPADPAMVGDAALTCWPNTASRLAGTGAGCWAISRSYSGADLSRTGATTPGRALQLLDPSITVRP